MIHGAQEGRKVMIEPPGDLRRRRILEVDDGVLVAGKVVLVEERSGAVHQAVILVFDGRGCTGSDALAIKRVNSEAEQAPSKHLS